MGGWLVGAGEVVRGAGEVVRGEVVSEDGGGGQGKRVRVRGGDGPFNFGKLDLPVF